MLVRLTYLVLSSATLSNEIFCVHLFLIENLAIFVTMFYYCMWMLVPLTHLVVSSATLSNEIFCVHLFLVKNHLVVFVPSTTVKWVSFCNHRSRKFVGAKHNVILLYVDVSASNISGVVLCIPFIWDILLFIRDQRKRVTQIKYLRVWW